MTTGVAGGAHAFGRRSRRAAEGVADSGWLERLARWGLVVRGVLYLVVALLAVQVASGGGGGDRADKNGALRTVAHQPLGKVLLVGLAIGFAGYAVWRIVAAVAGDRRERDRRKAAAKRAANAVRAAIYAVLFVSAVDLVRSGADGGSATGREVEADLTARALGWPAGPWLVGLAGAGIVGGGLYVGWRGVTGRFRERLSTIEMGRRERRGVVAIGVTGMVTRMVVLVLIGVLLVVAAADHDAGRVVGLDGALRRLAAGPFGAGVLVLVAAGLAAYGLYSVAEARYRRIGSP